VAFLGARGELDPAEEGPAARLTFPRLTAWILALRERGLSANTVRNRVVGLSLAAAAMAPGRDWSWVRQHPARPRHAEEMAARRPVPPYDAAELVEAALALCARADAEPPSIRAAAWHRDGLLLALATYSLGLRRGLGPACVR
jgi:hypothetical protein